jgi:DNA repair protein SbcD/Mre11
MPIKMLHTADVHLGLKFANYPGIQSELTETRFTTLTKLVKRANENHCDLFVIAGDLFDHHRVAVRDITRAAQILNDFHGVVAVLPGNHDFILPEGEGIWTRFKSQAGDRTILLEKPKIFDLSHYDISAHIYVAPCDAKNSEDNQIGWIQEHPKDEKIKYHIGIAHGSLEGVSPDPDRRFYPMTERELNDCKLDVWLLGHTDRLKYPQTPVRNSRIFYPATPEPHGYDIRHEGNAWILEINENKKVQAESLSAGQYKFLDNEHILNSAEDIEKIKREYTDPKYKNALLRLTLTGRLLKDDFAALREIRDEIKSIVFHFEWDQSMVLERITRETIDREYASGSVPHKLLIKLAEEGEDEALQMAYEMLQDKQLKI